MEINVSTELKKFLNMQLLFKETELDPIYEEDIMHMLNRIQEINAVRTNKIRLPGKIAFEFVELIKDKVKELNLDLGIIEIDIANQDFSIKDFVNSMKDISYSLKIKITSIYDLKETEKTFLESRYGILYEYMENDYHIDELYACVSKMKDLVKNAEDKINITEKNLKRAQAIANIVFDYIKLYVPSEYRLEEKEFVFKNGERLGIPNFRILEDTSHYANLINIFKERTADFSGMRKVCKECLRYDGYQMVERVSTIGNQIGTEMIIDKEPYGIAVTKDGIKIVKINVM